MKRILFMAVVLLATVLLGGLTAGAAVIRPMTIPLTALDPACIPDTVVISPDYSLVAAVMKHDDMQAMFYKGVAGPDFESVSKAIFSPDSQRMAYIGKRGQKAYVVMDGMPQPECTDIGEVVFSPNGMRMAYTALRGKNWRVVTDGMPGMVNYENIVKGTLTFSPSGMHVAFVGVRGGKQYLVTDNIESEPYTSIPYPPAFSSDERNVAYVGVNGAKATVIVNGTPQQSYQSIISAPMYDKYGMTLVYKASKNGQTVVVANGVESKPYAGVGPVVVSPDGVRVAFSAKNNTAFVVVNSVENKSYDGIGPEICFSPDGTNYAYPARTDKEWRVVWNTTEAPNTYSAIKNISITPDGKHITYLAQKGFLWLAVADVQEGRLYDAVDQLIVSQDGQHLAYIAQKDKEQWVVVVDGQEGPTFIAPVKGCPLRFLGLSMMDTVVTGNDGVLQHLMVGVE